MFMPIPGSSEGVVIPTRIMWFEIEDVLFFLSELRCYVWKKKERVVDREN